MSVEMQDIIRAIHTYDTAKERLRKAKEEYERVFLQAHPSWLTVDVEYAESVKKEYRAVSEYFQELVR